MPTLYLNDHEVEARLDDRRVALRRGAPGAKGAAAVHVPLFDVERVVLLGGPRLSLPLVHEILYQNIPVFLLSGHGRWVSSILPRRNGNALRRLRQYELARDEGAALTVARAIVVAKIRNQRRVLQRLAANRRLAAAPGQRPVVEALAALARAARRAAALDDLRGAEGRASALYFARLGAFMCPEFPFRSRNRRPPKDPVNALLSWAYAIVMAEVDAQIQLAGLDPALGFLHAISYGRPSLACDLIEPLRAPLCDLLVLDVLNHHHLRPADFEPGPEEGSVYLSAAARKVFFAHYERCMTRSFKRPGSTRPTDFRKVIASMVEEVVDFLASRKPPAFFVMP